MNIDYASSSGSESEASEDEGDDAQKVREREELRRERQKQRERELRMSKMGTEARAKHLGDTGAVDKNKGLDRSGDLQHPAERACQEWTIRLREQITATQ